MDKKCTSAQEHHQHLCDLAKKGLHQLKPKEYTGLVKDPQFVCKNCGRVAAGKDRLCAPVELRSWEE